MIAQVPELYDGGYWYAVKAAIYDDKMGVPFDSFAANYAEFSGAKYAAVRMIEQISTPEVEYTVSQILTACFEQGHIPHDSKFFARLEGR